jgi:hypothetical protein
MVCTVVDGPVTADLAAVLSRQTDAGAALNRLVRSSGLVVRGPEGLRASLLASRHLRGQSLNRDGS